MAASPQQGLRDAWQASVQQPAVIGSCGGYSILLSR